MIINIVGFPAYQKVASDPEIHKIGIPTYSKAPNTVLIRAIGIPISPFYVTAITIVSEMENIIPASIVVSSAVLIDLMGEYANRLLTFPAGSLIASDTGFYFGFDPTQYQLDFDIQYQIISGRTITEHFTL